MKRTLFLLGLLIVTSSCGSDTKPDPPSDASTEPLDRYTVQVTSAESPVLNTPAPDSTTERWTKAISGYDVLYFTAKWCPACKRQQPTLDKLRDAGYRVRMVDIDDHPDLAALFRISSIPAYVAARDGQVVLDENGRPQITCGMTPTADPDSWRVDPQPVLDLLDGERSSRSTAPTPQSHTQANLKRIAAGHNWRTAPAYVRFVGNMHRQDYLDHLQRDHGFAAEELAGWTTAELFQLHSALHCPNCRNNLNR